MCIRIFKTCTYEFSATACCLARLVFSLRTLLRSAFVVYIGANLSIGPDVADLSIGPLSCMVFCTPVRVFSPPGATRGISFFLNREQVLSRSATWRCTSVLFFSPRFSYVRYGLARLACGGKKKKKKKKKRTERIITQGLNLIKTKKDI